MLDILDALWEMSVCCLSHVHLTAPWCQDIYVTLLSQPKGSRHSSPHCFYRPGVGAQLQDFTRLQLRLVEVSILSEVPVKMSMFPVSLQVLEKFGFLLFWGWGLWLLSGCQLEATSAPRGHLQVLCNGRFPSVATQKSLMKREQNEY